MDLNLTGKVALVTGASQGIGRAIAERLAEEGAAVALAARSEARLEEIAQGIESRWEARGGAALAHATDLRRPEAPAAFVTAALARFGRVDIVVNNAGSTKRGDFLTLTDEDWAEGYALKLFGAMRLARAAWPHLVASGGVIVNIAGVGGRAGSAEFTIGGSVNAAVMHLTKSLADRGAREGVRVNAVNPGSIRTERLAQRLRAFAKDKGLSEEDAATQMAREMGVARFGEPAEIAEAIAFLASSRSAYIQGALLDVDGGLTRGM